MKASGYQTISAPELPHWPALDQTVLYGLAGEFVNLVAPETEADAAALCGQFLTAFFSYCYAVRHRRRGRGRRGVS
ncbi:MAG: hypothetical protein ACLQAT_28010 [Candidatus Binataceae bacterium]